MKKITILLPIYKLDEEDVIMMNNALESTSKFTDDVNVLIICPKSLMSKMEEVIVDKPDAQSVLYHNLPNTDFVTQINHGIDHCDTEWFSILEIDDEYTELWLSSMKEYMNAYPETEVFLPIVRDIDVEGNFKNFTNESLWAYGFTDNQGFLDNGVLLEFQNFQTSGGLYKTQVVKDFGKFKDNIKLTFTYEFLLRLTMNGVIIMGIPKIGYKHVNFRENSLFWLYKNDENMKLTEEEVKFWLETAKKEYLFKNKRDIIYVEK
jgi:hypothetical protein